jgi:hypothetical protein
MLRSVPAAEMPVDDGLLEFLGSVDSDDKNWHDYLAGAGLDQVVAHPGRSDNAPPPANPGASAPPATPPDPNAPSPSPGAAAPSAPPIVGRP